MKTAFVSIAMGCALTFAAATYAASDMGNMSMGSEPCNPPT